MKYTYYPLTKPQYNIHTQEITLPDTDVNVLYFVINIHEAIDENILQDALREFADNHQALHTRIHMEGTRWKQYFAVDEEVSAAREDVSMLSDREREELYKEWGQQPFIYQDSPLWEFRILKLSDTQGGLFCKFHHIWCDGWSTGLIWSEILQTYCCLKEGKVPEKKADTLISTILESKRYPGSEQYQEDQSFFKNYLDGIKSYHSRKSDDEIDRKKAERSTVFSMPKELTNQMRSFCKTWDVTPYSVFMGAIAVYDSGIMANTEAVIGMARLNRDTPKERELLGQFVVELPLRLQMSVTMTFPELCRHVLSESRKVAAHKKYAMADIGRDLRKESEFRGDINQFSLSFQREKISLGEYTLPVSVWFGSPSVCVEQVVIHVLDLLDDGYQLFYDYQQSCYQETTIAYLNESLMHIIQYGMNEEGSIRQIPLVGEQQQKALSVPHGEVMHKPDRADTLLDLFKHYVEEIPDKTAVCGIDGTYTYAEVYRRTGSVAAYLSKHRIKSEETVGVFMSRTCSMVFSMLGILRAGGSFVLMDQGYPEARIRSILEDSHMQCILTDPKGAEKLSEILNGVKGAEKLSILLMDEIPDSDFEDILIRDTQLCYMIYTSGTTGKPKGVQIEHRTIYNQLLPEHTEILTDVAENGQMAVAMGAASFDIFLYELFTNLMNGTGVVIASETEIEEPLKLAALMLEHNVDVIYGTPSRLLSYCEFEEFGKALKQVKILLSAGEAFPQKLYTVLHQIAPDIHIYNGYGPTEATIGTSFQRVEGTDITLGTPVVNYKLRCMDAYGRLLPYGVVGELYIGGSGLARGYTDSELTEKSFVYLDGERFYRSGDLVFRRLDEELLFAGRQDDQIKLRGFRIELEEIEGVLRAYESVKEAAVLVKQYGKAEFLCAFYTSDQELKTEELKHFMGTYIPYYMIPQVYVRLPVMPVTMNDKADKQRLSCMEVKYQQTYAAPQTKLQKTLVRLVEKVLELERVGIDDDFFDIGGDSLSIAHYAVHALSEGIEFEYTDIFRYPTIRRFSEYLEQGSDTKDMDEEIKAYDYTAIEQLLLTQTDANEKEHEVKRILLMGSTGYLGSHVLYELLKHTDAVICCLLRKKGKRTPEQNLNARFFYYFEESLLDYLGERVQVYEGNLSEDDLSIIFDGVSLDTVINCAGDVAHYSHGTGMRKVNVDSLEGMIKLCREKQARFLHISTISVGQLAIDGVTEKKTCFTENDFYFAQDLSNEYIRSKFLAERMILEEVAKGNLDGVIARVGNLQGRHSDGEFQINYNKNAFLTRLKSYLRLGFMPQSALEGSVDYSPIDYVARAICLLATHKNDSHVYHILNDKETTNAQFFRVLEEQGHAIEKLTEVMYSKRIEQLLADDTKRSLLSDMAADLTGEMKGKYMVNISCSKTAEFLHRLGFAWPKIDKEYLEIYIRGIAQLGFFDEDDI